MKTNLDFRDTQTAFSHLSSGSLRKAYLLFKSFQYQWIVKYGPALASWALNVKLPVRNIVKNTIFNHFCGGESIADCESKINQLHTYNIGSILDYSVEYVKDEKQFDSNTNEICQTILNAKGDERIPFAVFKVSGIGPVLLLEKNNTETAPRQTVKERFDKITQTAFEAKVRLFVDAEETWIQDIIDEWTTEAMAKYNKTEVLIYNTLQMYRVDRLEYLKKQCELAKAEGYKLGFKLVRGAYMEKERARAQDKGYPDPIQPNLSACHADYNAALKFCVSEAQTISICAGTHNEESCKILAELLAENGFDRGDKRFYFAQLLGMSDNISFNLADAGYNVAKYLPYGPIEAVMPYLGRRAQENTSVAGQTGRELLLIENELKRRKKV